MNRCEFCHQATQNPCMTVTTGCRLWKRYEEERTMNVRFMINPDKWPRWPLLPLKNRGGQVDAYYGFLVAGKGPIVFRGSMYQIEPGGNWEKFSREAYPDFDSLIRAGWRVD